MTRPISEPNQDTKIRQNEWSTADLRRRPLAGRWETPDLENGWTQPDSPWGLMQYRWHADGSLEFKGHLVPGSDGTVAFTLPGVVDTEPDYRPGHDVSFLTDVETGSATFDIARVVIDSVTGEVTIYFPVN